MVTYLFWTYSIVSECFLNSSFHFSFMCSIWKVLASRFFHSSLFISLRWKKSIFTKRWIYRLNRPNDWTIACCGHLIFSVCLIYFIKQCTNKRLVSPESSTSSSHLTWFQYIDLIHFWILFSIFFFSRSIFIR